MRFKAFIFDLDGTIVDSKLDFRKMRSDLGIADDRPILEEISQWPAEKQAWAHTIIDRHELEGAEASTLIQGVAEFLDELNAKNIPSAIFTRNSRKATAHTLKKHALHFTVIISRDDAPAKPRPEGLHAIMTQWKLPPHQILYVGDYLHDLKAGLAAGIPTAIFAPITPTDFDTTGATFLFPHFTHLPHHCR